MFSRVTVHLTAKSLSPTIKHCLSTIQLQYESYNEQQFQPNTKLFHELVHIASSAYEHPYDTIINAVQGSTQLYIIRHAVQNSPILGCSLVHYGKEITLLDRDQKIPVIYYSFTIVDEKVKNTGVMVKLLEYFARKMLERKQRQPQRPLLFYYITATPSVIYQTDKFMGMVPSIKDYHRTLFTDKEWHIANELRKLRNWPTVVKSSNANPFVVKGIMKSRYSRSEQLKIENIVKKTNYKIFQDLDIDETNGDRLLRFGFV